MNSARPRRITAVRGRVVRGSYGEASKSEREAMFIETAKARYILRRKNGPVFDDVKLLNYVGQVVECDGFLIGTTFLAEKIRTVN